MRSKESEEMYLETILILKRQNGSVRSLDVAEELQYSRASVSRGMSLLRKKGYIVFDENQAISFTESGEKKAWEIYTMHDVLAKMFIKIGASKEVAEENACRVEHIISPELFEVVKRFLNG